MRFVGFYCVVSDGRSISVVDNYIRCQKIMLRFFASSEAETVEAVLFTTLAAIGPTLQFF